MQSPPFSNRHLRDGSRENLRICHDLRGPLALGKGDLWSWFSPWVLQIQIPRVLATKRPTPPRALLHERQPPRPAALHALPPKLKSQLRLSSLFRNPVFCKFGFRIAVDWFLIVSIRMVLQCCNSARANPNGMVAQQFSWSSWVNASGF